MKGQRAEKFKISLFRHRCLALFVLSLPISATGMVTFVPPSGMSSSCECECVTLSAFGAKNIYLLGAEVFCWISSHTCFKWRFFRLVLFNVKIWSVPYWFVAAITVGTISDFWAFAERVRNEQSYLSAGVKKIKKGRWYGTGEEKVCSEKV